MLVMVFSDVLSGVLANTGSATIKTGVALMALNRIMPSLSTRAVLPSPLATACATRSSLMIRIARLVSGVMAKLFWMYKLASTANVVGRPIIPT